MASGNYQLEFERPLADLEARIAELDAQDDSTDGVVEKRRELRRELTELRKKRISITYVDHHHLDSKIIAKLKKVKVKLIHDTSECTSVLIYNTFKKK